MPSVTQTRRTVLAGGVASLVAGCTGPWPVTQAEREYPAIGKFVEADGLRVHYWEQGTGQPVVLVHGASGNLRDWTFDVAPMLARTHRVIAVDRPGFGYSERPPESGDPAVQARILRAATAKLDAERPIIVGHSWGGALALAWALDAPESVTGIVPVSAVAMPYRGIGRVFGALGLSSVIVSLYTEYLKASAKDGGIDRFIARVFRPQAPPTGYIDYVGAPLALREGTLDANAEDIEDLNAALWRMADSYGEIKVPVEIIHGTADFIDHEQHALGLKSAMPQAQLNLLEGVGHMAHHAAPWALQNAIARIEASV